MARAVLRRLIVVGGAVVGLYGLAVALIVVDGVSSDAEPSELIVVLGNKVEDDGTPSARLAARLHHAAEVFEAGGGEAMIVVSGGVDDRGFDEAAVMARHLVARGVPADRIVEDSAGGNTAATAANTARLMEDRGWSSVVVVSQYFHLSRTKLAFRQEGIDQVSASAPGYAERRDIWSLGREVPAYLRYAVAG